MKDFTFNIPTKIYFGKDNLDKLPEEIKKYGKKVLLVYGKNSIKKIGLYDEIVELFKKNDIKYWEVSGVVPNPRIDKVRKGVEIVKKEKIDFILAVGGGSTIDTAKLIAVASPIEEDPWDIVIRKVTPKKDFQLGQF